MTDIHIAGWNHFEESTAVRHSRSSGPPSGQGVGPRKPGGQGGVGGKEGGGPGGHQARHRGQHMQLQQGQQGIVAHAAQRSPCMHNHIFLVTQQVRKSKNMLQASCQTCVSVSCT